MRVYKELQKSRFLTCKSYTVVQYNKFFGEKNTFSVPVRNYKNFRKKIRPEILIGFR